MFYIRRSYRQIYFYVLYYRKTRSMKNKIRNLLKEVNTIVFTTPKQFTKWLFTIRKQENLFFESSIENSKQYDYSSIFIKELFWQIVCLRYLQILEVSPTEENLDGIETLIKQLNTIHLQKMISLSQTNIDEIKLSAWDTLKEVETLVSELDSNCENTKDAQNFCYLVRHNTGHDVIPVLRRFASNLSRN